MPARRDCRRGVRTDRVAALCCRSRIRRSGHERRWFPILPGAGIRPLACLSSREDMRFIGVTLPRVLARPPWEGRPGTADAFVMPNMRGVRIPRVDGAPATLCRRGRARFLNHAWRPMSGQTRSIRRRRSGDRLPIRPFRTDSRPCLGAAAARPGPSRPDGSVSGRSGADAALAAAYGEERYFSAVRSLQAPANFIGSTAAAANANARLSAQLNSILCASRFCPLRQNHRT